MKLTSAAMMVLLACATPIWAQDAPRLVKLLEVEMGGHQVSRQFFGSVVAKQTVDLAFQVGGQVVDFPAIEGDRIKQGALIAQLDQEPFQLALDQARVQHEQAQRTLDRLEKLSGSAVSQVAVDDAKTQADLAEIAVRNAERSLNNATLTAPFDALVASRNVANFTTVSAGSPIVLLYDMSELRIEIDVPEILFQRVGRDANVEIFAEFSAMEGRFPLEIREFDTNAAQVGRTFKIILGMEQPEGRVILPGSSVTVITQIQQPEESFIIPVSALVTANNGTAQVMVFEPTEEDRGILRATPIEITPTGTGQVMVTAGDVPQGAEIVASGAGALKDGEIVRRFSGFAN